MAERLDAAYAMLVDSMMTAGATLFEASDRIREACDEMTVEEKRKRENRLIAEGQAQLTKLMPGFVPPPPVSKPRAA